MAIGQELLNVPMGDMIRQMAFAIADAQIELDESSVRVAEMMSGYRPLRDADGNLVDEKGAPVVDPKYIDTRVIFGRDSANKAVRLSMMELGFTPTFYQFIETVIEVKIAIKITRERSYDVKEQRKGVKLRSYNGLKVTTTTVDASYSGRYGYSAEGSSLLRTKLAPVPPPAVLEERIRRMFEQNDVPPPVVVLP